ncbi:MAG: thiamine diphosphokinase [Candidatus Limnocylindrales bacterium]|jgi:thiamine pyrophosphokinase
MRALIVADGDVPSRAALDAGWPGWDRAVELVVAADGGWERAATLGLRPALLVGDGDSLPESRLAELAGQGVPIERSPTAKDESDAELALLAALRRGAMQVTILGAMGGRRFDHALANVGLLALPEPAAAEVDLLDASTRVRLLRAPAVSGAISRLELPGVIGDLVSLLPLGEPAEGITTVGLLYPLLNGTLRAGPARGLSNVRLTAEANVSLRRGSLLVVETRVDTQAGRLGTGDLM